MMNLIEEAIIYATVLHQGKVRKFGNKPFILHPPMKITTFNPQIITKDAEPVVSLFEELGFDKRHNPKEIGELNVEGIRMSGRF